MLLNIDLSELVSKDNILNYENKLFEMYKQLNIFLSKDEHKFSNNPKLNLDINLLNDLQLKIVKLKMSKNELIKFKRNNFIPKGVISEDYELTFDLEINKNLKVFVTKLNDILNYI